MYYFKHDELSFFIPLAVFHKIGSNALFSICDLVDELSPMSLLYHNMFSVLSCSVNLED